jgi:hypothetical protein
MRKALLFMIGAMITTHAGFAQYLYGTSVVVGQERSLVRFDPATNTFSTLLKKFDCYQPISTKDTVYKVMYFMAPNLSSASPNPDTLVTVKLTDTTVSKAPVAKGTLPFPMYTNGRLISASAQGMAAYNIATRQYSIIDSNVKITGLHSADFDHTRGRYICMKRNNNSSIPDTLFVYTMATRVLNKYAMGVSGTSQEMTYSPANDKVVFMGTLSNTASHGIFTFSLAAQQLSLDAPLSIAGGVLINCSTFDQMGNRYFCVKTTNNNGTGYNIIEYRLNTQTIVDHNVIFPAPGLGYPQYFDHLRVTAPGGSSVGMLNTEEPFKMYPNPAGNQLNVTIDLKGRSAAIRVSDLTGKTMLVMDKAAATNSVDVSALANGQYVLSIVFGDKTYSRLFVKS